MGTRKVRTARAARALRADTQRHDPPPCGRVAHSSPPRKCLSLPFSRPSAALRAARLLPYYGMFTNHGQSGYLAPTVTRNGVSGVRSKDSPPPIQPAGSASFFTFICALKKDEGNEIRVR